MKKILLLVLVVFMITGCDKDKEVTGIDVNKVPDKLNGIKVNLVNSFDDMKSVNDLDLIAGYGLDIELFDEYVIYLSSTVEDPSMYMILKPLPGNESIIKFQVGELFDKYMNAYAGYYPEAVTLIENRLEKEYKGYYIYVVSYDNDIVYEKILECSK